MQNPEEISYRKKVEDLLQRQRNLSSWLNSAQHLQEALQYVMDSFCDIPGIDVGGIYLLDPSTSVLNLSVWHKLSDVVLENVASYTAGDDNYRIMEAGDYLFVPAESFKDELLRNSLLDSDLLSIAILPLRDDNKPIGCINLASKTLHQFEPELQHVLIALTNQVAQLVAKFRSEARWQKMYQAVEQSPDAIVITDTKGNIEYANPRFSEISGYSRKDLIGKNPRVLKSGNKTSDEYKELWDKIIAGKVWRGEFLNRKKNGELYWESASISPIMDFEGNVINFVGIKEDITYKKTLQQELVKAKETAEESNRIKATLLNNLNNEFRTPLSAILGFTNLLRMEVHDNEQLEMLNSIMMSGEHLLNVLDSVITLAQLDSAFELHTETFDLIPLLNKLFVDAEKKLLTKGVDLFIETLPGNCMVHADPKLIGLAFDKLLENSLKSTEKGFVRLVITVVTREEKPFFEVSLKDSGSENTAGNTDRLFNPFVSESPTSDGIIETGSLGLNIASRIMVLSGGSMEYRRLGDQGREMVAMLPCAELKKHGIPMAAGEKIKADLPELATLLKIFNRRPNVLLVEDNEMNAMLVQSMLRKTCEVTLARNGETALNIAHQQVFDLVLMDINLGPGLNGMEVTRQMKKNRQYASVPFAAVTGYTLKEEIDKIHQSGLAFYLGKPFKKEELLDMVRDMLFHIIRSENQYST